MARVGHVVVVGASVAGMAAAAALAGHAERVTVIDRDSLPDEPRARKGTPQAGCRSSTRSARGLDHAGTVDNERVAPPGFPECFRLGLEVPRDPGVVPWRVGEGAGDHAFSVASSHCPRAETHDCGGNTIGPAYGSRSKLVWDAGCSHPHIKATL